MTNKREAMFYHHDCNSSVNCLLCPVGCKIAHGQHGFCKVRHNQDGVLYADHYGKVTSVALDPIEKKPIYHYYKGAKILSIGGYSCNIRCPFCQNYQITMETPREDTLPPEKAVSIAEKLIANGNIGIAFTYNEPFINYEYMLDTAKLVRLKGMKNIIVTNGYVNLEPLRELLPFIDAMNIDLKAFNEKFYGMLGGTLDSVKQTIREAVGRCHVEITTLIIPGENDSQLEIEEMSCWLAELDPHIPLHLSRFFPMYKMKDKKPTPTEKLADLATVAKRHLSRVYVGNV